MALSPIFTVAVGYLKLNFMCKQKEQEIILAL